jgi:hypothetical protein
MKYISTLLLILITVTQSLCAQAAAQDSAEGVTLRFVTFPKTSKAQTFTLFAGKDGPKTIEVSSNAISQPLTMPQLREWMIGEAIPSANKNEPNFKVWGKTKSLGSKRQLIIVIRKGSSPSDGVHLIAINDQQKGFKLGENLILNASSRKIGGIVGGQKFGISSGSHKIIEPKANKTGRYFHAKFFYEKDGKAKGFYSSNWPFSKNSRVMSFIYSDPNTKQLRFHTVRDFLK